MMNGPRSVTQGGGGGGGFYIFFCGHPGHWAGRRIGWVISMGGCCHRRGDGGTVGSKRMVTDVVRCLYWIRLALVVEVQMVKV